MILILLGIISILLCFKWGDWKNWKIYYPTILYYFIGVLTSDAITVNKPLWLIHSSFWNDTSADYFLACIVFPCIIILFLSNYPKRIIKQVGYIFLNVFIFSLIEYIAYVGKAIFYYNGWNIGWSISLYIGMFPLIRLHYKRPLLAWLILIPLVILGLFYFKINVSDLR